MIQMQIDMCMPEDCTHCPFYRGSIYGGSCSTDIWDDWSFGYARPEMERHPNCPLQEV